MRLDFNTKYTFLPKSGLTISFLNLLLVITTNSLVSFLFFQINFNIDFASAASIQTSVNKLSNFEFEFFSYISPLDPDHPNSTQILQPEGILTDESDNLYVNDIDPNEIKIYDKDGKFLNSWGLISENDILLDHSHSSEFDEYKNLYITDQNNKRIVIFSNNGTAIDSWEDNPSKGIRLIHPHGIDLNSKGNVFASDRDLNTIQKFSSNGTSITSWGGAGNGPGQFDMPWDVALDAQDRVYVADYGNNRIQVFDENGAFLYQWGTAGKGFGEFSHPTVYV